MTVTAGISLPVLASCCERTALFRVLRCGDSGGELLAGAYRAAIGFARDHGALFCHAYDQPEIAGRRGNHRRGAPRRQPGHRDDRGRRRRRWPVRWCGGGRCRAGSSCRGPTCHHLHLARRPRPRCAPVDVSVSGVAADALGTRRIVRSPSTSPNGSRPFRCWSPTTSRGRGQSCGSGTGSRLSTAPPPPTPPSTPNGSPTGRDGRCRDRVRRQHRPPHAQDRVNDSP